MFYCVVCACVHMIERERDLFVRSFDRSVVRLLFSRCLRDVRDVRDVC